jgi:hypothetical protein
MVVNITGKTGKKNGGHLAADLEGRSFCQLPNA